MYRQSKAILGSIAVKTTLAFMAMGATTAAAIVIGVLVFTSLSDSLGRFSTDLLPEAQQSAEAIDLSGGMGSTLTAILLAKDATDLQSRQGELATKRKALEAQISRMPADTVAEVLPLLKEFDAALSQMDAAMRQMFGNERAAAEKIVQFGKLAETVKGRLVEIVDSAYFDLTISGEETISSVEDTLSSLVETDFQMVTGVLQAKAELNLLAGSAIAIVESRDADIRTILRDVFASSLQNFETALDSLEGSADFAGYMGPLRDAHVFMADLRERNFFGTPTIRQDLLALRSNAGNMLSSALDDVTFMLAISADDAAGANSDSVRGLLETQVGQIRRAAEIEASVGALFSAALLGATAPNENEAAGAMAVVKTTSAALNDLVAGAAVSEDFAALVAQISLLATGDDGIVGAHRAALVAAEDAQIRSSAAFAKLALIADAARSLGGLSRDAMQAAAQDLVDKAAASERDMQLVAIASAAIFVLALLMTWLLIIRPLRRVTRVTERLASGDLAPVTGFDRAGGEIGRMATALSVFRNGMIEREEMQAQEKVREAERLAAERAAEEETRRREADARASDERRKEEEHRREMDEAKKREDLARAAEAERAARAAEQDHVVSTLATALDALASGDLSIRIEEEFAGGYEELRANFNAASETLADLIERLSGSVEIVDRSSTELTSAASDLARRTEGSAATLEQTSAAVTELSATARSSAERAQEANGIMQEARTQAEQSSEVVRSAIQTMSEIEASSQSVSTIVDLIENIAFQTNLLALNAGVEAARAGEDGRGFAVVATEVRALAQRSSDAAREINDLISRTRSQIERGVAQVGEAGSALTTIITLVSSISDRVAAISEASQEQSQGIVEIDNAVGMLDHSVQQNAAVCEETAAASQALSVEARTLAELARRFRTTAAIPAVAVPKVA